MLRIRLEAPHAKQIAKKILDGSFRPVVANYEIVAELLTQAKNRNVPICFYREDKNGIVEITSDEMKVAVDSDIEMRPLEDND